MGKTVKVPDPVYERVSDIADREDISRGAVIREWMETATECDEQ